MPEPVRVFHLIKSLGRGGAEVLLVEGLAVADRKRFTYGYGYFQQRKTTVVPALEAQGADVVCFGSPDAARVLLSARRVARHLRAWRADVVHAHLPLAGVVARVAGRMARVPVVYTEHNLVESHHPATRALSRLTWGWQARAIAISDDVARSVRDAAGEHTPLETVVNGVNTRTFDPAHGVAGDVRSRWSIPDDAPVVGTVAVFSLQKRLDVWLDAARRIHDAAPQTHFLLVGDGPLRADLEAQARALGLADAVRFVGAQTAVPPFLAAMDVFLMSSQYEGFGLAPVEAMSMETPVVATGVTGVRDIVEHGAFGYLADPAGPVADTLAGHVLTLLGDGALRRRMGVAARAAVAERYSIRRMQRELEAIYEQVVAEHWR